MRTLQKLRQTSHPPPQVLEEVRRAESGNMVRREARLWLGRLRRLLPFFVLGIVLSFVYLYLTARIVSDGLVVTQPVVARAPALVRVAEVFCRAGQWVRRGSPLVRLEALTRKHELRGLAQLVEQRRLRLALLEAGGRLDVTGQVPDTDVVADAEREAALADAAFSVALARVQSLTRQKVTLEIDLLQQRQSNSGRVAQLQEQAAAARASVWQASAGLESAELDARSSEQLREQGVLADREAVARRAEHAGTQHEVDHLQATARAAEVETETARALEALDERRTPAALAGMEAEIEVAREQVSSARRRRELWLEMAERYRRLRRSEPLDGKRQLDFELRLLRAELAESQARLDELGRQAGNLIVRAESDCRIDRVDVVVGSVVDSGAELVCYYDPSTLQIVAFATPDDARVLEVDLPCSIVVEGSGAVIEGRVASLGSSWVSCPKALPKRREDTTDLRRPVSIQCVQEGELERLGPNVRLKVLFSDPADSSGLLRRFGL